MDQHDTPHPDPDGWPVPSEDVRRDLDRHGLRWPEPEADAEPARA